MNIILLDQAEWLSDDKPFEITLNDGRATHIGKILRSKTGDQLRAGLINGSRGIASVVHSSTHGQKNEIVLRINPADFSTTPPSAAPVNLIIALPRPKTARRIVRMATELGIKQIHFINSYKVEKSYWQSPLLSPENLHQQILMGLEQTSDTVLPEVYFHKLFKPFVEDRLQALIGNNLKPQNRAYLAHPDASEQFTPMNVMNEQLSSRPKYWIVIGPEGGFTNYEVEKLIQAGCEPRSLGSRILRTETVVPFILGRLFTNS